VSWTWRYDAPDGAGAAVSAAFSTQSDAETWVGETYTELLELGVRSVTLVEDGRDHYRMSLEAAD